MIYGICTGCHQVFLPGPYFKRRIVRHLRLLYHNHDAVKLIHTVADMMGRFRIEPKSAKNKKEKI